MPNHLSRIVLVASLLAPALTHAQAPNTGAAAAEIRQHQFLALENYDLSDYASARADLTAAIERAAATGLDKDILNARSHLMLGGIYLIGNRDEARALEQFKLALTISPGIQPEPPFDTDAIKALLARADAELHPVITCTTLRGIDHQQVLQANEGAAVAIAFKAGPELKSGTAHLSYRTSDASDFVEVPMSRDGECGYAGEIPADAVRGELIHYFVAMKKNDGRYIAMRGNRKSPYPISVIEVAEPLPDVVEEAKEETPEELFGGPKRGAGCAGCSSNGMDGSAALLLIGFVLAMHLARRRSLRRP